jgi:hypothetical protein
LIAAAEKAGTGFSRQARADALTSVTLRSGGIA